MKAARQRQARVRRRSAATSAKLLRTAGVRQPQTVVQGLQVLRPYEGALAPVEFDRTRPDILNLTLIGGEEIRW